ncbi:hypothetical protein LZ30DRAFT_693856 [Colletotrichum cereale]|nr:hypothetical protein LZ30DRAFT_693856 [Colletotrichum cereale]
MANYLIAISARKRTNWQTNDTALACYSLATFEEFPAQDGEIVSVPTVVELVFNRKYAYWLSYGVRIVKICTLSFVIITGFVVLGGGTTVKNPKANFQNARSGSATPSAHGLTTALYRVIFSNGGYNNAFNVSNEVKVYIFKRSPAATPS